MGTVTPALRQRLHELNEAHKAARHLEQRLEMCVDWPEAVNERQRAKRIRESIAAELIMVGQPMADFAA